MTKSIFLFFVCALCTVNAQTQIAQIQACPTPSLSNATQLNETLKIEAENFLRQKFGREIDWQPCVPGDSSPEHLQVIIWKKIKEVHDISKQTKKDAQGSLATTVVRENRSPAILINYRRLKEVAGHEASVERLVAATIPTLLGSNVCHASPCETVWTDTDRKYISAGYLRDFSKRNVPGLFLDVNK